jgi:hypothetical protein
VTAVSLQFLLDETHDLVHEDLVFDLAGLSCDLFGLLGLEFFVNLSRSLPVGIGVVRGTTLR